MGSQIINVMKLPIVVVKLHIIIVKVLTTVVKLHLVVVKLLCRAPKLFRRYKNCVIGHQSCYGVTQGAGWRDSSALFLYIFLRWISRWGERDGIKNKDIGKEKHFVDSCL
jgi:hypothetical protein